MSKKFGYYDSWRSEILHCDRCGWAGTFEQGIEDFFDALMESRCPVCNKLDPFNAPILAIVSYPTNEDTERNWEKLSEHEKKDFLSRKKIIKAFNRKHFDNKKRLLKN